MRTFTVVPSFEGESAYFELPDIGFQGDHLSFAILFNLTELTEHWPNIVPAMIVTDPKANTFVAPHTSWNPSTHIFTWSISNVETAYDGYLMCQLKCTSADDPETIVCMSRICQTRVYQSLAASSDPPEAFQTWLDTLVQLGAEVSSDLNLALESVETTETNARTAQAAADAAELSMNAAEAARISTEQTAQIAISAQEGATSAQQRALNSANAAETAKNTAVQARDEALDALEEADRQAEAAAQSATNAEDSARRSFDSMTGAQAAQSAAETARDAAVVAKGQAEVARDRAEAAKEGLLTAQRAAEAAQAAAEIAQGKAEDAQEAAETAQAKAEYAQEAAETAQNAAETAQGKAEDAQAIAEQARDEALDAKEVLIGTGIVYEDYDESITLVIGANRPDDMYPFNAADWIFDGNDVMNSDEDEWVIDAGHEAIENEGD